MIYSVAHFLYSAGYQAFQSRGGDFCTAIPGPLMFRVTEIWPWLEKAWIAPRFVASRVVWNYGPVLHVLTLPLVFAPSYALATRIVLFVNYGLLAATFVMWRRLLFGPRPPLAVALGMACLWLNYFPLLEAITGRELEVFELFLLTGAIWALRRDREWVAGMAIGIAAMTKFLPVIFIPYLLTKGFRTAFWTAMGTVAIIATLAQWLLGFQHALTLMVFTGELGTGYYPAMYMKQALINVLYKMFTVLNVQEVDPTPLYPTLLRPIGMALHGFVLLASGWFVLRWRRTRLLEIEVALLALIMVLVAPHSNTYYLVFALPALSVAYAAWLRHPRALGRLPKATLIVAVVLSGFLVPMKLLELLTGLPAVVLSKILQLYSLPAFGAIFAVLVLVELHRNLRTAGTRPQGLQP